MASGALVSSLPVTTVAAAADAGIAAITNMANKRAARRWPGNSISFDGALLGREASPQR
jgi:hypothetical protein